MSRLWVKVIKRNRIEQQATVDCKWGDEHEALTELLKTLDLPTPMWLTKHENEFAQYAKTSFSPDNFVEEVRFQRLEVDFLDDTDKKKTSKDPRNAF